MLHLEKLLLLETKILHQLTSHFLHEIILIKLINFMLKTQRENVNFFEGDNPRNSYTSRRLTSWKKFNMCYLSLSRLEFLVESKTVNKTSSFRQFINRRTFGNILVLLITHNLRGSYHRFGKINQKDTGVLFTLNLFTMVCFNTVFNVLFEFRFDIFLLYLHSSAESCQLHIKRYFTQLFHYTLDHFHTQCFSVDLDSQLRYH